MSPLTGKVAIVTGSGRGIGRAIAGKLASAGAAVVVNDLDDGPAGETTAAIEAAGGRAVACNGDVAAADFGDRIVAVALAELGGLDIIVNNAGYIWNTTIQNNTDEQWQAMLDVHATAPFRLLRAAQGHFRDCARREAAEGAPVHRKVVNISSVSGLYGSATQGAYAAGKMAVVGLTKSLAKEWGRHCVNVNAVAYGFIGTRLTQSFDGEPAAIEVHGRRHKVGFPTEMAARLHEGTSLGRAGTTAEAAGAVYILCLPEADFITGQVLVCDGGHH
ncbi:MAG: SDR family oxidoreductase [Alphaproteobacteria bacterium]|jgi:3-oxoacyl-[acyl-carrier protein] reductase|nr:SDR family oxidoreductase [Alphaproteobacteria bacterium]